MIIKAAIEGKEHEFKVLGGNLGHEATHILTTIGVLAWVGRELDSHGLLLRLIHNQHTFGDLVFEETGEDRVPQQGEWYLASRTQLYPVWQPHIPSVNPTQGETYANRIILRHVCGGEV